jgi:hypothetical protein
MDFGWLQQTTVEEVAATSGDFVYAEPGNPGNYQYFCWRPGRSKYRYVQRSPMASNDFITPFMFKLPGYSGQVLNMAALSRNFFDVLKGVANPTIGRFRI